MRRAGLDGVGLNPGLCICSFEHTFEVYTEGERLYLFGLESADLAREWVKCIAKVGLGQQEGMEGVLQGVWWDLLADPMYPCSVRMEGSGHSAGSQAKGLPSSAALRRGAGGGSGALSQLCEPCTPQVLNTCLITNDKHLRIDGAALRGSDLLVLQEGGREPAEESSGLGTRARCLLGSPVL